MNKKILLMLLCCTYIINIQGQTKEHVSLAECNNDTLKFIETNFIGNESHYIGKTYSDFIEDFEMNIYLCKIFYSRTPNTSEIWGIKIVYMPEIFYYIYYKRPFYAFYFEFEKPYTVTTKDFNGSILADRPNYYNQLFKNYTIKDMAIREESTKIIRKWKEFEWR